MTSDQIERTITTSAAPEQVWAALTTEEGMKAWFGDIAVMDVRPGGAAEFGWSDDDHVVAAVIETVEPYTLFAFRWAVGTETTVEEGPSTLVEFILESEEHGTLITVIETGFESIPEDVRAYHFEENTKGWKSELDQLAAYLADSPS